MSETTTYKCDVCDFETEDRFAVKLVSIHCNGYSSQHLHICDDCRKGTQGRNPFQTLVDWWKGKPYAESNHD